jgi:hypothetical protein
MDNKAEYQISSSVNEGILEIILTGKATASDYEKMANERDAILKANNAKKVIVDFRALEGRIETTEIYRYVRNHHSVIHDMQFALVDLPENAYLETAVINAGLKLNWYTDIDAARAWLKSI